MKRISMNAFCLLMILLTMSSCKQNPSTNDFVTTDTTKVKPSATNKGMADKSSSAADSDKSLNQLIQEYKKVKDSTQFDDKEVNLKFLVREIVSKHLITAAEYKDYRDKFWGTNKVYEHPISMTELKGIVQSAEDDNDDYVKYTFTNSKDALDFQSEPVKTHDFKSYLSCFSVIMLQNIANDPGFENLSITKGIKNITGSATIPDGDYTIAMLLYKSKDILGNPNTQYFDIVEDPTHN